MSERHTCSTCHRTFEAVTVGGGMTSPEPEPLKCPYCGFTRSILSSGRLVTRALPEGAAPNPPALRDDKS